ncbi:MAG: thiamine pyrophosphate-binding protein, partial [Oscillospiraceae bacterium]|nr:thiamine pyrophosphate-binding protein [Oscillospiraceae bacterium]
LYLAVTGRPGPCWLDVPLDSQSAIIETEELVGFTPEDEAAAIIEDAVLEDVICRIRQAERPVLFVGNGVRLSGAHGEFMELVSRLNIPVVNGMSSVDAMAYDHPLYVGKNGSTGDRAGNFAVQNSDLLLSLGSRLSFFQTGFNYESWARAAYKIVNDIDPEELEKDSIRADCKLCCDVKWLIEALLAKLPEPLPEKSGWLRCCRNWKEKYPVTLPKHYEDPRPNIYVFYKELSERMGDGDALVVSAGTSRVAGSQASRIAEGMRFYTNPACAAMGYCLPAAIGVCVARGGRPTVVCTGEGSFQMNLQELQTIIHNKLPIKIFLNNNEGYHSIRMTQNSFFGKPLVGVGEESGDLSFPDLAKLAPAYGFPFRRCEKSEDVAASIEWALAQEGPCICEMMLSPLQLTEPKAASKKLPDGRMVSAPLEDMAPFLPREELMENLFIEPLEGQV